MISEELLEEVYVGTAIDAKKTLASFDDRTSEYTYFDVYENESIENIYELAHKVKEWAWGNGYRIKSQLLFQYFHIDVSKYSSDFVENVVFFKEMTEPEAVFKAGEWILKEISK